MHLATIIYYTIQWMNPSSMELNILTLSTGFMKMLLPLPQLFEIAEFNFIRLCIAVKEK